MTRQQLLSKISANISPKPFFFNTAAKIKTLFEDVTNAVFDNAAEGLLYTNTVSTTALPNGATMPINLTVNYIGAYAVGNIVKLTAQTVGFGGLPLLSFYLGQITAINSSTKVITVALFSPNYILACSNWTFTIVAVDKWGIDRILESYKLLKEPTPTIFESLNASDNFFVESTTTQNVFVKKTTFNQNVVLTVSSSSKTNEIITITNISPLSESGNTFTPVIIEFSQSFTMHAGGPRTISLESRGANSATNYNFSISFMRINNIVYIIS